MKKKSIILIHGAWHASWCWHKVARQLAEERISVLTPDLPGHGAIKMPAKNVSLKTYTQHIINLINEQDEPVCLVGHSMGGMVISQVAEIIPDKISQLIYVAAYIPKDQESLFSIAEQSSANGLAPYLTVDKSALEIRLGAEKDVPSFFYHRCSEADLQFAVSNWQPQPLLPFADRVTLGKPFARVPKRSIICQQDRVLLASNQLQMSKAVTDDIVYIDTDHSPFFSQVESLAKSVQN